MPRKNHPTRTRREQRVMALRRAERDLAIDDPTPFQMALDLVERGLASPTILGPGSAHAGSTHEKENAR